MQCWWECKFVQPLWKAGWKFLKELKMEQPYDPAIPFPKGGQAGKFSLIWGTAFCPIQACN